MLCQITCRIIEYFFELLILLSPKHSFYDLNSHIIALYNSIFIFWTSSILWIAFTTSAEDAWSTRAVTFYFCTIIGCSDPNCITSGIELSMWYSYGVTIRTSTVRVNGFLWNESISIPSIIRHVRETSRQSSTSIRGRTVNCVTVTTTICRKPRIFMATVCG